MKKTMAAVGVALGLGSAYATAGIVQVPINAVLADNSYQEFSIDGDLTKDIGLNASVDTVGPTDSRTYIYLFPFTSGWHFSWLSAGQVVDSSLSWTTWNPSFPLIYEHYTDVPPVLPGLNYLAVRNPSLGNYYGYITIDFQQPFYGDTGGYTQTLVSYTYDDTGAGITVPAPVPVPASLALLGLGLVGLGAARRKQA